MSEYSKIQPFDWKGTNLPPVFDDDGQNAGQVVIQSCDPFRSLRNLQERIVRDIVATERALIEAREAIRCACDLLRQNAPGRAREVLEAQLNK